MLTRPSHPVFMIALLSLVLSLLEMRTAASDPGRGRADFSGTWALSEDVSDDPSREKTKEGPESSGDPRDRGGQAAGRGGARNINELADLPLEAIGDARLLVIIDKGSTVQVTYSSGRKRELFPDGLERELDDGDGTTKVTTKRRGESGEKVIVSSKWSSGRGLMETWELFENPRRLSCAGKVSGRRSFHYQRVYIPAPPQPAATPTVPVTAVAIPASAPPTPTTTSPPGTPAGMATCSIRPPKRSSPADLARMAKISGADASKRAVASVAPLQVSSVISSDVEVNEGCLVWPFDLRLRDKKGVLEVLIDAGDGRVLK